MDDIELQKLRGEIEAMQIQLDDQRAQIKLLTTAVQRVDRVLDKIERDIAKAVSALRKFLPL